MSDKPPMNMPLPVSAEFDPANEALADALRKSFNLLKWLMAIVVVLYLFSGLFRVKPGEVGYILRMGRVVTPSGLEQGWHWSWPFPIDEARTLSLARDMTITVPFMFQLSDEQKISGVQPGGSALLRPGRDWYLLTGDLNILHAELKARYVIDNPVNYLKHVYDDDPYDANPPEFRLLSDALSASAIEVAARRHVDEVYRDQGGYLAAVADRVNERLNELEKKGKPVGIKVRQVLATDFKGYEGILPPLAVLQEFINVTAAEQEKGKAIAEAKGKAFQTLIDAAGSNYEELAKAIDAEFAAQRANAPNLPDLRKHTEELLAAAKGQVSDIIAQAQKTRDGIVGEAKADAAKLQEFASDYEKHPDMLLSRLRLSLMQRLFSNPRINTTWVPSGLRELRVLVPRDLAQQTRVAEILRRLAEEERRAAPQPSLPPLRPRFQAAAQ